MADAPGDAEVFVVTLAAVRGWGAPAAVRLKRLLKAALRGHGLRCLDVRRLAEPEPHKPAVGADPEVTRR